MNFVASDAERIFREETCFYSSKPTNQPMTYVSIPVLTPNAEKSSCPATCIQSCS